MYKPNVNVCETTDQVLGGQPISCSKMGAAASSRVASADDARTSPAALQWQDANKLFAEIDSDGDGTITGAEMASVLEVHGYPREVSATLMEELDIDKDGVVAFDEWRERFYSSSFCSVKQPPSEDFGDLLQPGAGCQIQAACTAVLTATALALAALAASTLVATPILPPPQDTAMRGITPKQLSCVQAHLQRRCGAEGWKNWAGKTLTPNKVSLCAAPPSLPPATSGHPTRYMQVRDRTLRDQAGYIREGVLLC